MQSARSLQVPDDDERSGLVAVQAHSSGHRDLQVVLEQSTEIKKREIL